jgi:UDP-xylose:glucoside alpha-1,3-xylosyltransferase
MKLEDMRKSSWEKEIKDAHRNYSKQIVYGDQDLINVYFHHHPKEVDVIPCEYNYRSDHCMNYNDFCVAKDGVKILHGSRGMFHSNEQPIFKQIYSMFQKVSMMSYKYCR